LVENNVSVEPYNDKSDNCLKQVAYRVIRLSRTLIQIILFLYMNEFAGRRLCSYSDQWVISETICVVFSEINSKMILT